MTPLYAEANRWLTTRYQWGVSDCLTMPADWVLRMTGADPAADLRLTYGSAGEAQRAWRLLTDPLAAMAPRMDRCGLRMTTGPVPGDVGIIVTPGEAYPHGALCFGKKWAVFGPVGVLWVERPKIIAAWGTGYCAD